MLYEIGNEIKEISSEKFSSEALTLALLSADELKANGSALGLNTDCLALKPFQINCGETEYMMNVEKISTDVESAHEDSIYIVIRKNLLAVIDCDEETKEHFFKALANGKKNCSLERLISYFLYALTTDDMKELDGIEYRISKCEDAVLTGSKTDNVNSEILKIKRKLLRLRSFYEQMSDIADELVRNDIRLFAEKKLRYFRDYGQSTDKLASKVDMLRESLVQLREAYQASIDLKLNNTMKFFTVIATIFLPLTLITSWYGMNFVHMPELKWRYGYIYVIALSAAVAVGCIVWFKKKKFM